MIRMQAASLISAALLIVLSFTACKKKESNPDFVPGDLAVGFHDTTQIQTAFDLMNKNGLSVESVVGFTYSSPYPVDSVSGLIGFLNQKAYINRTGWGAAAGNVYYYEKIKAVFIGCRLFDMNLANQEDFIKTLSEKQMDDLNGKTKYFLLKVTIGQEQYWLDELSKAGCIKWAELNKYAHVRFE